MADAWQVQLIKLGVDVWNKWRRENLGGWTDEPVDEDIDLAGVNLRGADLRGAVLLEANLRDANLRGADLQGANLLGANLQDANLQDAGLQGANLLDANLLRTNLRGAGLLGADLLRANLLGADLRDANLRDADLSGALDLEQDQLDLAFGDWRTRLPEGLQRPEHWEKESEDEVSVPKQKEGPQFSVGAGRLIELAAPDPLDLGNDRQRLEDLLPELRQLAKDLADSLRGRNAYVELLALAESYSAELDRPMEEIRFHVLAFRGMRLQNWLEAAKRNEVTRLDLQLEDRQAEALNSAVGLGGPFLLASAEGREFLEAASLYSRTSEEDAEYKELGRELAEQVGSSTDLVTVETAEFVAGVNEEMGEGPHPERTGLMARRTFQNFLSTAGLVAVGTISMFVPGIPGDALKKSKTGQKASEELTNLTDTARRFLLGNEGLLRRIAAKAGDALGWLPSVIDKLKGKGGG